MKIDNSPTNKVNQILVPFKNFNKSGKWPEQVNIYCWHCCHPFKTKPVSIPIFVFKATTSSVSPAIPPKPSRRSE